jgi:ABC-type ATPase with predicted acetyltransferase domain
MFEFLTEFADFCLQLMFWYFVGQAIISLLTFFVTRRLEQEIKHHEEIIEKVAELIHSVEVEEHNNMIYWFDSHDGRFLAQGKDMEELMSHLKSRFSSHVFILKAKEKVYKISGPDWNLELLNS